MIITIELNLQSLVKQNNLHPKVYHTVTFADILKKAKSCRQKADWQLSRTRKGLGRGQRGTECFQECRVYYILIVVKYQLILYSCKCVVCALLLNKAKKEISVSGTLHLFTLFYKVLLLKYISLWFHHRLEGVFFFSKWNLLSIYIWFVLILSEVNKISKNWSVIWLASLSPPKGHFSRRKVSPEVATLAIACTSTSTHWVTYCLDYRN